jgi:hypothetical protein
LVRVTRRVGRIRNTYSPRTATHHLPKTTPASRNRQPRTRLPGLYTQQGTLASPNHTVRLVTADTDSTRPAVLLRHGCAGKPLYNDRGADKTAKPECIGHTCSHKDRKHNQLAHPCPVSRARVPTDKEATTRGRTTAIPIGRDVLLRKPYRSWRRAQQASSKAAQRLTPIP